MNERRGKQNSGAPRPKGAARGASPGGPMPPYFGEGSVRPVPGGVPKAAQRKEGGRTSGRPKPAATRPRSTTAEAKSAGRRTADTRGKTTPPPRTRAGDATRRTTTGRAAAGQPYGRMHAGAPTPAAGRKTAAAPAGRAAAAPWKASSPIRQGGTVKGKGKKPSGRKTAAKKKAAPGKLRPQTAAQRRKDIRDRRGLTPEQMEFIRRRNEIKRYYIKKRRISAITLFLTRFTALVIIYVVLFVVTSGLFVLSLVATWPAQGEDVVYQLGENRKDIMYKVETLVYRERVRDGQLYLNFTEIAEYLDFITTGDPARLRYLTRYPDGEEVVFDVGTSAVTVNGNMTRMPAQSYYENGALYVPLDFIETYIKGISVGINEETGRLVLYRLYTQNTKNEKIYEDITFTLKPQTPSEHIDENSLPADIKLATEPSRRSSEQQSADGSELQ
ncbi:MAG: stalk domain-containing protein [Eubacteriales bacterium]|jgi:hypothetical protein